MGLQTWPPSKPPLSPMACLDVETPSICRGKFKSVLQLCLQQRRSREQLVEQGIMPPLKTPAAFHEQIRSLERARAGNVLKHKLCSRPDRSELVRLHILQETQAEPSLQATQMKLKRARLADDLNEKIAQRPGAMELVEKNILRSSPPTDNQKVDSSDPCSTSVFEKSQACSKKDVYKFDEDVSDALSPKQPASQSTPGSSGSREAGDTETDSCSSQSNSMQLSPRANSHTTCESLRLVPTGEQQQGDSQASTHESAPTVPSITPAPLLVKQSLHRLSGERSHGKKSKEPKPRMKKLKYHQYIPPDQKQEHSDVPMDSAYARLLQQQQQFLQLQILKQQQQQYGRRGVRPVTLNRAEVQSVCSSVLSEDAASFPLLACYAPMTCKHLPANLDEMKVAELKMELKLRSLPVSGTKTDLIERLKLYRETSNIHAAATMETPQPENLKSTPPVSPIASKVSSLGIEDNSVAKSPAKLSDAASPAHTAPSTNSPQRYVQQQRFCEKDSEKDKRLYEKEQQIEELMRKLEQEQRLVEELKMQLEVEKRSQQGESPPQLSPTVPIQVKEENASPSSCFASCVSGQTGGAASVKQEEAADQSHLPPPTQRTVSQRTVKQPETLQSVQAGALLLLPAPSRFHGAHTHTSGQVPPNTEASAALQQQSDIRTWRMETTTPSLLNAVPVSGRPAGASSGQSNLKQPCKKKVISHTLKCKDPPTYEDAVKQTHSMLTSAQADAAASQHMDDLFDVLIESGEISPLMRQDPSSLDKPLPVTASVTTLPINTALSRPPPLVQVARLPAATGLAALASDTQLPADAEAPPLTLMEELHSPLVAMEVDFMEHTRSLTQQENIDWLDLTLSVPGAGVNPLDMPAPVGVFSSDFLDSNELHLNWD